MREDNEKMNAVHNTEHCTEQHNRQSHKSSNSPFDEYQRHLLDEINTVITIFAESNTALKLL